MTKSEHAGEGVSPRNDEELRLVRNWIVFGVIAGILGDIAYFLVVAIRVLNSLTWVDQRIAALRA